MSKYIKYSYTLAFFVLAACSVIVTANIFFEADAGMDIRIKEAQENQDKHLGEKVVIGKDTLVVVDTDFWCKYVLSKDKN